MESVSSKLRSGKQFLQEYGSKLPVKDSAKRLGDVLPDNGGKKRILGDITNAVVSRGRLEKSNGSKGSLKSISSIDETVTKDVLRKNSSKSSLDEDSSNLYTTACEEMYDSAIDVSTIKEEMSDVEMTEDKSFPPGVEDFDSTCMNDPCSISNYASEIFKYYKEREKLFPVRKYLHKQSEMTKSMRAILVDWMVEVQESFELNHETLYLAVKLVDFYLIHHFVPKTRLQLIGATAVFVASKFDERLPPLVDDFLYICDDSYSRGDLLDTEKTILRTANFDLGIPLSYRFLRRYARVSRIPMDLLTLARYILETALMDYDLIEILDSKIAAGALLLALKMRGQGWNITLEYYSGYKESELLDIIAVLNKNISGPPNKNLQTIRLKYSHPIFFEVAKVPALNFSKPVQ